VLNLTRDRKNNYKQPLGNNMQSEKKNITSYRDYRGKPYSIANASYLLCDITEALADLDQILERLPDVNKKGFADYTPGRQLYGAKSECKDKVESFRGRIDTYLHAARAKMQEVKSKSDKVKSDSSLLNSAQVKAKYTDTFDGFYQEYLRHKEMTRRLSGMQKTISKFVTEADAKKYPRKRPDESGWLKTGTNNIFEKEAVGNG